MESAQKIVFKIKLGDDLRRWSADDCTCTFEKVLNKTRELFSTPTEHDTLLRYEDDDGDWVTLSSDEDLQEAIEVAKCIAESSKLVIRLDVTIPNRTHEDPQGIDAPNTPRLAELEETVQKLQQRLDKQVRKEAKHAEKAATKLLKHGEKAAAKLLRDVSENIPFAEIVQKIVSVEQNENEGDTPADLVEHPRVNCDICNMSPIVGIRFKKKGANYDLCQTCYDTQHGALDAVEAGFIRIEHPHQPWRRQGGCSWLRNGLALMGPAGICNNGPNRTKSLKPQARFVEDINIPENTEILPGTHFTKIWRLRNSGTDAWPQDTKLIHIGGDKFEGDTIVDVAPAPPGEEVDVAVSLVAPMQPGRYVSYWRLAEPPRMRKFGQRIWVQVVIVNHDGSVNFEASEFQEAVHNHVCCDVSGMNPIVGQRYHKIGCDYDLCEAEFQKLSVVEKTLFERIDAPGATPVHVAEDEPSELKESEVNQELEARHGWTETDISALQHSTLARTVESLQEILPKSIFLSVVETVEPAFSVQPEYLARCLDQLEPLVAAIAAEPSSLEHLSEAVAVLVADPAAFAASGPKQLCTGATDMSEHVGIWCDGCGATPIRGLRYMKQLHTDTYDLCSACYVNIEEDQKADFTEVSICEPPNLPVINHDTFPVNTDDADVHVDEPSPKGMQETLAEMGIAQADLSASMLADMEQQVNNDADAERAAQDEARLAAEVEAQEIAAQVEVVAQPCSIEDAISQMGFCEDALTASIIAEIEEVVKSNAQDAAEEQAQAAAVEEARLQASRLFEDDGTFVKAQAEVPESALCQARAAAAAAAEEAGSAIRSLFSMTRVQTEAAEVRAQAEAAAAEEARAQAEAEARAQAEAEARAQAEAAKAAAAAEEARAQAEAAKAAAAAEEARAQAEAAEAAAAEEARAQVEAAEAAAAEEARAQAEAAEAAAAAEEGRAQAEAAEAAAAEEARAQAEAAETVAAAEEANANLENQTDPQVDQLQSMGFDRAMAINAIVASHGNMDDAINMLISDIEAQPEAAEAADTGSVSEDSTNWDALMEELYEMGFEDADVNRAVLAEANGDVKDAVKELVNRERRSRC